MPFFTAAKNAVQEPKPTRRFTINVVGSLWNGQRSAYTYTHYAPEMPDAAGVKRIAGDFQSLSDYQITDLKTEYEDTEYVKKTITTRTTVRPWEDYDSETFFLDTLAANGN